MANVSISCITFGLNDFHFDDRAIFRAVGLGSSKHPFSIGPVIGLAVFCGISSIELSRTAFELVGDLVRVHTYLHFSLLCISDPSPIFPTVESTPDLLDGFERPQPSPTYRILYDWRDCRRHNPDLILWQVSRSTYQIQRLIWALFEQASS